MKSVCIIPARSGSKRLHNKNIFSIYDKPMFYWSYKAALDSGLYSSIYLSTDSEDYADLARSLGISTIIRPHNLSNDQALKQDAIVHAKQYLDSQGLQFDLYMSLQANSPDVQPVDLRSMHSKLIDDKRWEVISVDSSLNQNGIARVMRSSVVENKSLSAVLGVVILNRSNIHTISDVESLVACWNPL